MKVILIQDVENLGKKFEIKDVKSGYARNFLIPKGLAKPATKEALKWLSVQKEIQEKMAEEALKETQNVVTKIDGLELEIPVKIGDQNQLFEKVTTQKISEKLKEAGYLVSKNQINLDKPIEEIGEYPIKIKFDHNLEGEIRVIVVGQTSEEKKQQV